MVEGNDLYKNREVNEITKKCFDMYMEDKKAFIFVIPCSVFSAPCCFGSTGLAAQNPVQVKALRSHKPKSI